MSVIEPCPCASFETAGKMSNNHIQREIYKKWIQFCSSEEWYKQVKEIKIIILDALANEASEKDISWWRTISLLHPFTMLSLGYGL